MSMNPLNSMNAVNPMNTMIGSLSRNWWAIALRGALAILFGILATILPGITLQVLVLLFGAYALVDGIFAIIAAIQGRNVRRNWGWLLLEGVIGVIIGIVTFFAPGITALSLLYFIAAWAILTGIAEIVQAIQLRQHIQNEWLLILGGIASVLFGLLLILFPSTGALAVILLIGGYAIVFGILLLALAWRLRGMEHSIGGRGETPLTA